MRLHHLRLTAFGPFAGTQQVDFDALSAAGLFLLHGPTGAGKTSVLDAVCYALYGQVPGARPATRLRSDHAAPGTATEVVLELTVAGRRLEITRRPEQLRAKKRGTGLTPDKALTHLREHKDGRWHGLSTSHQEVGEEIKQLLGMSCEQFCQVVLLPQGEFATFLRATAMERTALLGRLFDTRRFKAVEHWLRDRRQDEAQRLTESDRELAALAARIRQAAGPAPVPDEPEPGDGQGLLGWAAILRCEAREQHGIARAALARAERTHTDASRAATGARALHAAQTRHAAARARAAALDLERPARTAARARLAAARRAAAVEPALSLRTAAAARHTEAAAAEHTAKAALPADDNPGSARPHLPRARPDTDTLLPAGHARTEQAATGGSGGGLSDAPGSVGPRTVGDGSGGRAGDAVGRPLWVEGGGTTGTDGAGGRAGAGGERFGGLGAFGSDGRGALDAVTGEGGGTTGTDGAGGRAGAGGERFGGLGAFGSDGRGALDAVTGEGGGTTGTDGAGGRAGVGAERFGGLGASGADGRDGGRGTRAGAGEDDGGAAGPGSGAGARPGAGDDVLARRAGELREELGGLGGVADAEARVRVIGERRAALDREERAAEGAVREAGAWLDGWPQERARLSAAVDAAMEAAARAAGLAADVAAAERRSEAAADRDRLRAEAARAEDTARDARDRGAAAREAWQDLREARIAGIAAELAADLADGHPCRVCGATGHPAPAAPADHRVTRADEDAAYAAYRRESTAYELANETAARLRAALGAAVAVAGDTPRAELAAARAALAADHAATVREAAGAAEARAALDRAEGERDRRAAQRQEALSRTAARTSRREELDDEHQRLTAELGRARAGHTSVAARREHLAARIALLDRAADAVRDRAGSERRLAEARAALEAAVAAAGFASPAAAAAALLPAPRLAEAARETEAWDREEAALDADLTAPEDAAAARLPPAEPESAEAALTAATRGLRDAAAAESAAAARGAELDRLGALATARVRHQAPARAAFARLKRLSDLTSANTAENTYRMELETYVLAARLEQVAAAAGVRLQRMSAGRYTLVHTDARGGGRAKSGLGLMVVDAWTGTERDTATLSGGETFFASLALALGLADVVTDEAGGTRLDTLFIDEGFGSLDEQTLDEVLDVLDSLRERDRAVGIVSHVADLRHRIPVQLSVTKGRDGSSVRMRTTAAAAG